MHSIDVKDWIAALRSGKYTQAQHTLKHRNGFCCLGVAMDLAGFDWSPYISNPSSIKDDMLSAFSPNCEIVEGLDLTKMRGYGDTANSIEWTIAAMNDEGASFEEIADYLESFL